MAEMTRDEKLARYRHLREISAEQQSGALTCVARDMVMDYGRRLGVVQGRALVCESMAEMTLVIDLAVHTGKAGRSRAIDRYASRSAPELTGDEALMLRAAQAARFHVWQVERPHEGAGLLVSNVIVGGEMWLMDEGIEASCQVGDMYAARMMAVEDFVMTCGAAVPVNVTLLAAALDNMPNIAADSHEDMLNDQRFAIGIYRAAIETGTMERVRYLAPGEYEVEQRSWPDAARYRPSHAVLPTDHPPAD
jgi:hypothetical protein